MDHTVLEGSCSKVKKASLEEIQIMDSSNNSRCDLSTHSLQGGHEIGANYRDEGRNVRSGVEDIDEQMRFCCSDGLSDDNECTWLSSGCTSTSFLNSDDLKSLNTFEIDLCDSLLYDQCSMLRVLDVGCSKSSLFDGSCTTVDPTDEASPALTCRIQGGGLCEDLSDNKGKEKYSSGTSLECAEESVHEKSHCNDLSTSTTAHGLSSAFGTTHDDEPSSTPSEDHDSDGTGIWVPLVDLEGEESEWDGDGFDVLDPDFPSPSYRIITNLQIRTSKLTFCPSFKQLLDVKASLGSPSSVYDLSSSKHLLADAESPRKECSDADEPLFWPFDWKSYWRPEFRGNYLGISPRASILKIERPNLERNAAASKSLQIRLHNRKGSSLQRENNIPQGYGARIMIRSTSRSARPGLTDRNTNKDSKGGGVKAGPSRLSKSSDNKSTTNHSKKGGKGHHQSGFAAKKKRGRDQKSSLVQYLLEFEAVEFEIYLAGGTPPIEALVGLDEFDGHEGVGKMMRASPVDL